MSARPPMCTAGLLESNRPNRGSTRDVLKLTHTHDGVLALLDWLPNDVVADAALVTDLLDVPEFEAVRLLDELVEAGYIASATGPVQ